MLSQPRSGVNLVTCSMQAVLRKPIGNLRTLSSRPVVNQRLELHLVSTIPFIYRTHCPKELSGLSLKSSKLIFLTRNLKELLFRKFFISCVDDLEEKNVKIFIRQYLNRFLAYESWNHENRFLVYYEDYILQENEELLLNILNFIGEEPSFFDDFLEHKEEYLWTILQSYRDQHKDRHGNSSINGPRINYWAKNTNPEILKAIDEILEDQEPLIFEKYLKRFRTE